MDPSEVKVLVVEDDEFTRMATIDILKSCRYHVEAVENGKEALELLQSNHGRYDLVLCDVMLPVMTGIELLDELQQLNTTFSHIPVVMTSSNEEMDVVTSCLSKGAKDYLIKPIQVNTAKTLVRHVWLSRRLEKPSSQSVWRDLDVIRTIGKGTHGTVVLARRRVDGAVVAVKRVRISMISESGRKQADNEVILLKSLYHVNIVRFYDQFMAEDELNIVMEYADGGNLRQLVKLRAREKMGPFPESVIMCWFAQLVLAVAYIHGKNVLHRDLKAQNVFLTRKNVVKLGDFGISKALAGDDTANTACGTPESMSPEICRGEPYGKKSDIWSLGCILYEMIMCKRPFEAATLPEIFTKICKGDYPPILPTFSRELRLLVQLMLQQDASKRPSIEDICRFPFVQQPIQAFLSEHVAEFQEALELEAKLHQPSLYTTKTNGNGQQSNVLRDPSRSPVMAPISSPAAFAGQGAAGGGAGTAAALANSAPRSDGARQSNGGASSSVEAGKIRSSAIAAAAVGLALDNMPPTLKLHHHAQQPLNGVEYSKIGSSSSTTLDDTLADELRSKVEVTDVRAGVFTTYTACVSAFDLGYALKKHFAKSEDDVEAILTEFLDKKVLSLVNAESISSPDLTRGDTYLRFQVDELFVPLNMKYICNEHVQPGPMDVCLMVRDQAADLHRVASFPRGISTGFHTPNALPNGDQQPTSDEDDNATTASDDFQALLPRLYRKFLKLVAQLQRVEIAALPKHERQAFFINIYNTMVLHGLIEFGVPQNIGQYKAFEKDVSYMIGGLVFSLGDIKHGILRCNRKPPSNYWEKQLQANDPKLHYRLHIRDPRSLLVLMDFLDPLATPDQIPILKPGRTDTDLEEQVEKYCARHIELQKTSMEIVLPRVFRNFRDDFGASESDMLSWLSQYMEDAPANLIQFRVRYQNGIST